MIRKTSQKMLQLNEKQRRVEVEKDDNEYFLSRPSIKIFKTAVKEVQIDTGKEKGALKSSRKGSLNDSLRTNSINKLKLETFNQPKEQSDSKTTHSRLKIDDRIVRSYSHCEVLASANSKSSLRLQLGNRKDLGGVRKINLRLDTPTNKKERVLQGFIKLDSDYHVNGPIAESRTVRSQKRQQTSGSQNKCRFLSDQPNALYNRFAQLVETYQRELKEVKRENALLLEENLRLKGGSFSHTYS